jgi:iron complex outermembrane receptor protein
MAAGAVAQEVEEILVTGIRASLADAIQTKRNSNSIVDAISSEDIGKFPDQNVAESLQRVPGVTITRQFGEGSEVSIRGAGSDLTFTTLNGQNVASTGWFVFQPAKRSFNYELLPSELVGGINVYKSSQADLQEGGIGGSVDIITRKPLDLDPFQVNLSAEGSYSEDSGEIDPQLSALASWKNASETFGFLVSAVAQERSLQRQGNEAFWEWGAGPVAFEQDRERRAFNATLQWQPVDQLDLVLNAVDMEMGANNTNYALWLTQGNTSWGAPTPDECMLNGEVQVCGPLNVGFYQARPREATMKSQLLDLSATWTGESFVASFQAGSTESSGGTDFEMVLDPGSTLDISNETYDFRGGSQSWSLDSSDYQYDPGSLVMGGGATFNRTPKTDEETYFEGDLEFDVDLGLLTSVKVGGRYSDHNTTSRTFIFEQANGAPTFDTAVYADGLIDVGAGDYQILNINADAAIAAARASITGESEDIGTYSEIDEQSIAVYAMATYEAGNLRGNFGVRYVSTDAASIYYSGMNKETVDASYSEVLPSLNIVYSLSDDMLIRGSAAKVMSRPQYIDMYENPYPTGADNDLPNDQYWIKGNVGLKPYTANQFDVAFEWYFADASLLSAGLFYKDVSNFVTFSDRAGTLADTGFGGALRPEEIACDCWTIQEKSNNTEGEILGLELQAQYDFGNGFGTIGNYTYTDSSADESTFLDGNAWLSNSSEHSYNLTGYYEADLYQVRVAYNWRSEYMLREVGAYGNRLHDDFGSLDLSASLFLSDSLSIDFDANNLLAQNSQQFGNNQNPSPYSGFSDGFPLYEYETSRRLTVGVRYQF